MRIRKTGVALPDSDDLGVSGSQIRLSSMWDVGHSPTSVMGLRKINDSDSSFSQLSSSDCSSSGQFGRCSLPAISRDGSFTASEVASRGMSSGNTLPSPGNPGIATVGGRVSSMMGRLVSLVRPSGDSALQPPFTRQSSSEQQQLKSSNSHISRNVPGISGISSGSTASAVSRSWKEPMSMSNGIINNRGSQSPMPSVQSADQLLSPRLMVGYRSSPGRPLGMLALREHLSDPSNVLTTGTVPPGLGRNNIARLSFAEGADWLE